MSLYFQFRPLQQWPHKPTPAGKRKRAPFGVGLVRSYQDLTTELNHIGASGAVYIEAGITSAEIRNDGLPRSEARFTFPGIVVNAPVTKKGAMRFACDTYSDWTGNIHAITLTLTSLRAVSRYGAVRDNEQYRGFSALPPPGAATAGGIITAGEFFASADAAAAWVATTDGRSSSEGFFHKGDETFKAAYRRLVLRFHPDRIGGQVIEDWKRLQEAQALIEGAQK